jgi:hypothetical protein
VINEELAEAVKSLPKTLQDDVSSIGWNHNPEDERKKWEYCNKLMQMIEQGSALSLENSGRLLLNTMHLLRENSLLRKRLDEMVVELLSTTMRSKYSFRQ